MRESVQNSEIAHGAPQESIRAAENNEHLGRKLRAARSRLVRKELEVNEECGRGARNLERSGKEEIDRENMRKGRKSTGKKMREIIKEKEREKD